MTRRDFSERDIHMALDGELPGEERMAYDAWLDANPEMKAKSARYVADRAALSAAFAGVMDEPVPARLRKALLG
jgi:anti-sigma factor RsiW